MPNAVAIDFIDDVPLAGTVLFPCGTIPARRGLGEVEEARRINSTALAQWADQRSVLSSVWA